MLDQYSTINFFTSFNVQLSMLNPISKLTNQSSTYLRNIEFLVRKRSIKDEKSRIENKPFIKVNSFLNLSRDRVFPLNKEIIDLIFSDIFYNLSLNMENPSIVAHRRISLDPTLSHNISELLNKFILNNPLHSNPFIKILILLLNFFKIPSDELNIEKKPNIITIILDKTLRQLYMKELTYTKDRNNTKISLATLSKKLNENLFHAFIESMQITKEIKISALTQSLGLEATILDENIKYTGKPISFNKLLQQMGFDLKDKTYINAFKSWLTNNCIVKFAQGQQLKNTKDATDIIKRYKKASRYTTEFGLFLGSEVFKDLFNITKTSQGAQLTLHEKYAHTIFETAMLRRPFLYSGQKNPTHLKHVLIKQDASDLFNLRVTNKLDRVNDGYHITFSETPEGTWFQNALRFPKERYKISEFFDEFYQHLEHSYKDLLHNAFTDNILDLTKFEPLYHKTWSYLLRIIYNINFEIVAQKAFKEQNINMRNLLQDALDLDKSTTGTQIRIKLHKMLVLFEHSMLHSNTFKPARTPLDIVTKSEKLVILEYLKARCVVYQLKPEIIDKFRIVLDKCRLWGQMHSIIRQFYKKVKENVNPLLITELMMKSQIDLNELSLLEMFYDKLDNAKFAFKGFLFDAKIYRHFDYFHLQEVMMYTGRILTNTGFLNPMNYALARAFVVFYSPEKNKNISTETLQKFVKIVEQEFNITIDSKLKDLSGYWDQFLKDTDNQLLSNIKHGSSKTRLHLISMISTKTFGEVLAVLGDTCKKDRNLLNTMRLIYEFRYNLMNEQGFYTLDCSNSGFQHIFMAFRLPNADTVNLTGNNYHDVYSHVASELSANISLIENSIANLAQELLKAFDEMDFDLYTQIQLQNHFTEKGSVPRGDPLFKYIKYYTNREYTLPEIVLFYKQSIRHLLVCLSTKEKEIPVADLIYETILPLMDYLASTSRFYNIIEQYKNNEFSLTFQRWLCKAMNYYAYLKECASIDFWSYYKDEPIIVKTSKLKRKFTKLKDYYNYLLENETKFNARTEISLVREVLFGKNTTNVKELQENLTKTIANSRTISEVLYKCYKIKVLLKPLKDNIVIEKALKERSVYKRMLMAYPYGMTFIRSCETIIESIKEFIIANGKNYDFDLNIITIEQVAKLITRYFYDCYIPQFLNVQKAFLSMNTPISRKFREEYFTVEDNYISWKFKPPVYMAGRVFSKNSKNERRFSLRVKVPNYNVADIKKMRSSICPIIIHYADSMLARIIWKHFDNIRIAIEKENLDIDLQLYKIHDSFSCNMFVAPFFKIILTACMEEHLLSDWFKTYIYNRNLKDIPEIERIFEAFYETKNPLTKITNPNFVRL